MQNSIDNTEIIAGTLKSKESQYFLVTILAILSLAAFMLVIQPHSGKAETKEVPKQIKSSLLQLSNASEELNLLIEIESLPQNPKLEDLINEEIVPFTEKRFRQLQEGCIVQQNGEFLVAVIQIEGLWRVAWQKPQPDHGHGHSELGCHLDDHWQIFDAINPTE